MNHFSAELARLNPAQRAAVETIEGPLLIVAGPGTGKTQTISLRLANILKNTQARPHNLLALTYTDAGAVALKSRLARLIGSDAYGIQASTFHSFCGQLAALFPSELGTARERRQLDSLGQFKLIREIVMTGDFPLLGNFRAPDLYIRDIASRIQTLKREGISPARLQTLVADEARQLPLGDDRLNKKTGKPLGRVIDAEKRVERQTELVRVYERYQHLMHQRELADYDDLILSVVEALQPVDESRPRDLETSRPSSDFLLAYLQEQYLYVTVDEYQDTNGAQNALLSAWASYDDTPNLCAVGDDDQSIYRFQGASLANIISFTDRYPSAAIVTLTENYRSTQPILDAASALIGHNTERLVGTLPNLVKDLHAARENKEQRIKNKESLSDGIHAAEHDEHLEHAKQSNTSNGRRPAIEHFPTPEDEAAGVTHAVQTLLASGTSPSEIAVLYRQKRDADLIAQSFTHAGVPHVRTDGADALRHPRVRQLVQLITALHNAEDKTALMTVLTADYTGISIADSYRLARLAAFDTTMLDVFAEEAKFEEMVLRLRGVRNARENKEQRIENKESLNGGIHAAEHDEHLEHPKQSNNSTSEAIERDEVTLPIRFHEPEKLATFATRWWELYRAKTEMTLDELVTHAAATSGLTEIIAANEELDATRALARFLELAGSYAVNQPTATLADFLADLRLMTEHGIPLATPATAKDAVTLATAHGSKGLEWAHVFIVGCIDDSWGGKKKPDKLPLPSGVVSDQLLVDSYAPDAQLETKNLKLETSLMQEERRLFFVAMTRARETLTLTHPATRAARAMAPSRFLAELGETATHAVGHITPADYITASLPPRELPPLDPEGRRFLSSLVEHLRLSATGLNTYLTCGRKFLYSQLLRLPTSIDPHMQEVLFFGTATHAALERYFGEFKKTETLPESSIATEALTEYLRRLPLSPARRAKLGREASEQVVAYLTHWHDQLTTPPFFVEYNFGRHDVRLGDIPLAGKADRIDLIDSRTVRVIDYKTKTPKTDNDIRGLTANSDGNDYRQLVFYKLLASLDTRFPFEVGEVTLSYTRPEKTGQFIDRTFAPTQAEVEELRETVTSCWDRITALDFAPTEDTLTCQSCPFRAICQR